MATAIKPFKMSHFISMDEQQIDLYLRTLDKDLQRIVQYLNIFPRVYTQSAQPTIATDSMAFWKDSDDNKFYLLKDIAGVTKKIELT